MTRSVAERCTAITHDDEHEQRHDDHHAGDIAIGPTALEIGPPATVVPSTAPTTAATLHALT